MLQRLAGLALALTVLGCAPLEALREERLLAEQLREDLAQSIAEADSRDEVHAQAIQRLEPLEEEILRLQSELALLGQEPEPDPAQELALERQLRATSQEAAKLAATASALQGVLREGEARQSRLEAILDASRERQAKLAALVTRAETQKTEIAHTAADVVDRSSAPIATALEFAIPGISLGPIVTSLLNGLARLLRRRKEAPRA